jgi:hypothetical protein
MKSLALQSGRPAKLAAGSGLARQTGRPASRVAVRAAAAKERSGLGGFLSVLLDSPTPKTSSAQQQQVRWILRQGVVPEPPGLSLRPGALGASPPPLVTLSCACPSPPPAEKHTNLHRATELLP